MADGIAVSEALLRSAEEVSMYRFILTACSLMGLAAISRADAESYFEERIHDFGATPRGPVLVHYFNFTNSSKETLTISALRVSCGCVTATAQVTRIKPGESSYIVAQMDTRRFTGNKEVTIYIQFSAPRYEEIALQVKANGRDDFSINPQSLAFGAVRKGSTAKASAQVTFIGDANWKIDDVKVESNYVKAEAKLIRRDGAQVTYEITAQLQPNLPAGKWFSNVWLHTNNPAVAKARIPLTVDVNAPVTASPEMLQLGEVKIGDSVEQNVLIRGAKPFKIKEVRGAEPAMHISGISSEAKMVHVLKIEFKPESTGELKRAIAIVTDDGNDAAVTIPIQARAIRD